MKQLINRFSFENLRNKAHVQLHENFIILVDRYKAEELGIAPLYFQYKQAFDKERDALDVILKSGLTDEILAVDAERDSLFRGLVDTVKAGLNHFDAAKRTAAERLHIVVGHYGNIAAMPLDEETAAVDDLLRELAVQPYVGHVATLGLAEWLTKLADANSRFNLTVLNRSSEASVRPTINMRAARREVDKIFRAILDLLEALATVTVGANAGFILELNALTQRYENILAQEKGIRDAKAAAEERENATATT